MLKSKVEIVITPVEIWNLKNKFEIVRIPRVEIVKVLRCFLCNNTQAMKYRPQGLFFSITGTKCQNIFIVNANMIFESRTNSAFKENGKLCHLEWTRSANKLSISSLARKHEDGNCANYSYGLYNNRTWRGHLSSSHVAISSYDSI